MIRAIIIEDEESSSNYLVSILDKSGYEITVLTVLTSVHDSIEYLRSNRNIDLIFCDVQLTDGLSFSIFNEVSSNIPIIFVTAYDKFVVDVFEYNGIDYILKPYTLKDVQKALRKYDKLRSHFKSDDRLEKTLQYLETKKRTRMLVKVGAENISLPLENIVLFYTKDKLVYAVDENNKKYSVERNLAELETDLQNSNFFRVNRQFIVNAHFIKGFKTFERVKLALQLSVPNFNHEIIISQETAPLFKKWINRL